MKAEPARRIFFKSTMALACSGAASLLWSVEANAANVRPKGKPSKFPFNPTRVPQFSNPLPNPLAPSWLAKADSPGVYTLTIQQISQSLGLGAATKPGNALTTVWGYGSAGGAASYPGPTFDLESGSRITVTYVNGLVDGAGNPLQNPMPVDNTIDWANPGGLGGLAPVPVVTHLHGGDSAYTSDGLPDAWSTPGDIMVGRLFSKPYDYDNDQEAGHLWYHDHALGVTRTNVYMGLAGLYFLRDANENALRTTNVLPSYPYEVPIVIQDRMFNADGSLFYPSDLGIAQNPTVIPEFFGDVILVNTQAWPVLQVEPRKYRLRILNGSDSRFYELRLVNARVGPAPEMMVIGNELGLLDTPALSPSANYAGGPSNVLAIAPGERYDVIIDFAKVPDGTRLVLTNSANSPYPDGTAVVAGLTDRIMAFDVVLPMSGVPDATVAAGAPLRSSPLGDLDMSVVKVAATRRILLLEGTDRYGRLQPMLGTVDNVKGQRGTLVFKDPITETPAVGTSEIWEFYNTTVDAHPIHMHLVDFRVVDRQTFTGAIKPKTNSDASIGGILSQVRLTGTPRLPGAWEAGRKDTVQVFPGEVTRVLVNFKRQGEYAYHCHILSHEDHEMMRPYRVV